MSVKAFLIIAALVSASACSSYTPPPEPTGPRIPVNDVMPEETQLQTAKAGSEVQQAVLLDDELNGVRQIVSAADGNQANDKALGLKDVKDNRFRK